VVVDVAADAGAGAGDPRHFLPSEKVTLTFRTGHADYKY